MTRNSARIYLGTLCWLHVGFRVYRGGNGERKDRDLPVIKGPTTPFIPFTRHYCEHDTVNREGRKGFTWNERSRRYLSCSFRVRFGYSGFTLSRNSTKSYDCVWSSVKEWTCLTLQFPGRPNPYGLGPCPDWVPPFDHNYFEN